MKKARVIALILALAMLLPTGATAAGLTEYIDIEPDKYDPAKDGYYGYLAITLVLEDRSTIVKDLPVLVKKGLAYASLHKAASLMDVTVAEEGEAFRLDVYSRSTYFKKDSAEFVVKMGRQQFLLSMDNAAIWQDGELWVPVIWLFQAAGGIFIPMANGTIVVGPPELTAIDVLCELTLNAELFSYEDNFGIDPIEQQAISQRLRLFDAYDGMWSGELDKWYAVLSVNVDSIKAAFGSGKELETYNKTLDVGYTKDYVDLLMNTAPDEASVLFGEELKDPAKNTVDFIFDCFGEVANRNAGEHLEDAGVGRVYAMVFSMQGNFKDGDLMARMARANQKRAEEWLNINKWALVEKIGFVAVSEVFNFAGAIKTYTNRDTMALAGAKLVTEKLKKYNSFYLSDESVKTMTERVSAYDGGKLEFAGLDTLMNTVKDAGEVGVGLLLPLAVSAFSLSYSIISRIWPGYGTARKSAEAFEQSLIGTKYQYDAHSVVRDTVAANLAEITAISPSKGARREELFNEAAAAAYQFIKARYVNSELALQAFQELRDEACWKAQEADSNADLARLRALSSGDWDDQPTPDNWVKLVQKYDASYITELVTPMYLHAEGTFIDAGTGEPLAGLKAKVYDQSGVRLFEVESDDDGAFEVYLPLSYDDAIGFRKIEKPVDPVGFESPYEGVPYFMFRTLADLTEKLPNLKFVCEHEKLDGEQTKTEPLTIEMRGGDPSEVLQLKNNEIMLGLDYYQYLKDTVIPVEGMAKLTNSASKNEGVTGFAGGLVSADVRDYDGDGVQDMLAVFLGSVDVSDTVLKVEFTRGTYLSMELRYYSVVDGEIRQLDKVSAIAEMERESFGDMGVSVYEFDGVPYILGSSYMEDMTTYGPTPKEIYHVEDGRFVHDLIGGGIGWGQGYFTGDINDYFSTRKLELFNTPLELAYVTNFESAEKKPGCAIAAAHIDGPRSASGFAIEVRDYTFLAEILEKGYQAVAEKIPEPLQFPREEWYKEIPEELVAKTEAFMASASKESGITLTKSGFNVGNDGSYSATYKTPGFVSIYVTYTADGAISYVSVSIEDGDKYSHSDRKREWITLKDSVMGMPELGLDTSLLGSFMGDCQMNGAEVETNGYTVGRFSAGTSTVRITKNK